MNFGNKKENKSIFTKIKGEDINKIKNIGDVEENKTFKTIIVSKLRLLKFNNNEFNTKQNKKSEDLLKNIKYAFNILNNIIKYLINLSKTNLNKSSELEKQEIDNIILPKTIDKLILLISYFPNSFNKTTIEKLYNIIHLEYYKDLYSIYEINDLLMSFIDNGDISVELLNSDFNIVYDNLVDLSCNIFNINTDFENISYIE